MSKYVGFFAHMLPKQKILMHRHVLGLQAGHAVMVVISDQLNPTPTLQTVRHKQPTKNIIQASTFVFVYLHQE